jgi:hypothetical protein
LLLICMFAKRTGRKCCRLCVSTGDLGGNRGGVDVDGGSRGIESREEDREDCDVPQLSRGPKRGSTRMMEMEMSADCRRPVGGDD